MMGYDDFALPPEEQIQIMASEYGKAVKASVLQLDDGCKLSARIFLMRVQQLSAKTHTKFLELDESLHSLLRFSLNPTTKQNIVNLIDEQKNIYDKFSVAFENQAKQTPPKVTSSNFYGIVKAAVLLGLDIILNILNIKSTEASLDKQEIFDMLLKELAEFVEKLFGLM